jgi:hypothetical protein
MSSVRPAPFILATLIAAASLVVAPDASACSIPVFRYALERWPASPYEVVIFRKGDGPAGDKAAADRLAKLTANVEFRAVDIVAADIDPADAELWKQQPAGAPLPRAVIRYPDTTVKAPSLWAGAFDVDAIVAAIESPARREIAKRLTAGESCVWVLLGGKDKAADDSLAETLGHELKRLQSQLQLPEVAPDGPQLRSPLPLRLAFSVVRVARDDPREATFVEMLKHVEPDYANSDDALVIPVIGRGRAVSAIPASRVTEGRIDAFAEFVSGQCSCEVKEQNPGIDLLMAANWDAIFGDEAPPAVEPPAARDFKPGATVPIPVSATPPPVAPLAVNTVARPLELRSSPADSRGWLIVATAVAAALALVSGAVVLRGRKK